MHLRFAEFEFRDEPGHLLKSGSRVPIQEKPFRILSMLLAHHGQLVTRKEILRAIWADTYVVEDQSLNTAMRKVRLALNDSPDNPKFIETVGSRGYRFIHPVQAANGVGSVPRTIRVAVLPLENLGAEADEHFSDGVTEEMIACLGRLRPNFAVIALSSVLRYKNRNANVTDILRDLGADYVLSGSIRRSGNRVRISIRLICGADQSCAWADTFDRDLSDVFAIQHEVASNVARSTARLLAVGGNLREPESAAHENYLRGRFFWNKRTAPALLKSVELFNNALAEDPDYTLSYVGLADAYVMLAQYGILPGSQAFPIVREAAVKALTLDDLSAAAHVSMAWVKAVYEHDLKGAEYECKTALRLDPNYSFGCNAYAFLLTAMGRHAESIEFMRRGLQLDPVSLPMNTIYASVLYFARQYEAAIEQCKECLELDPSFSMAHAIYGQALEGLGLLQEAAGHFQTNAELAPWNPHVWAHLGRISALQDMRLESLRYLEQLSADADSKYVPFYFIAQVYAALGEPDLAFEWLARARKECSNWAMFTGVDPKFDQLHSDPRFRVLLQQLGLNLPSDEF
jgi:TolB-like protein/Tfp pilus assembly protein PilF